MGQNTKTFKRMVIYNIYNNNNKMLFKNWFSQIYEKENKYSRLINVKIINDIKYPHGEDNSYDLTTIQNNQPKYGTDLSCYIKLIKNLYVIDFDKVDGDTIWNDYDNKNSCELFNYCQLNQLPYTITKKGIHFYITIDNMINYTAETKICSNSFYHIDLIGGGSNNIWENIDREIFNYNNIKSIDWNNIKEVFNIDKMTKNNKYKNNISKKLKKEIIIKNDINKYNYYIDKKDNR